MICVGYQPAADMKSMQRPR